MDRHRLLDVSQLLLSFSKTIYLLFTARVNFKFVGKLKLVVGFLKPRSIMTIKKQPILATSSVIYTFYHLCV